MHTILTGKSPRLVRSTAGDIDRSGTHGSAWADPCPSAHKLRACTRTLSTSECRVMVCHSSRSCHIQKAPRAWRNVAFVAVDRQGLHRLRIHTNSAQRAFAAAAAPRAFRPGPHVYEPIRMSAAVPVTAARLRRCRTRLRKLFAQLHCQTLQDTFSRHPAYSIHTRTHAHIQCSGQQGCHQSVQTNTVLGDTVAVRSCLGCECARSKHISHFAAAQAPLPLCLHTPTCPVSPLTVSHLLLFAPLFAAS